MQKRHFEFVAEILSSEKPKASTIDNWDRYRAELLLWNSIVDEFADRFKASNIRFDKDKFKKACNRS